MQFSVLESAHNRDLVSGIPAFRNLGVIISALFAVRQAGRQTSLILFIYLFIKKLQINVNFLNKHDSSWI